MKQLTDHEHEVAEKFEHQIVSKLTVFSRLCVCCWSDMLVGGLLLNGVFGGKQSLLPCSKKAPVYHC